MKQSSLRAVQRVLLNALVIISLSLGAVSHAYAQGAPAPAAPAPVAGAPAAGAGGNGQAQDEPCTNFEERRNEVFGGGANAGNTDDGILSSIYIFIRDIVEAATENLYTSIVNNPNYQYALTGAVTLMVAVFGVFFTIGLVQASFGQLLMRLIKLGLIYSALSPSIGWQFFSSYLVTFFNDGTDEIVKGVIAIGTGVPVPAGATPFYQLDKLGSFLIHPQTIVAMLGMATSGPFSLGMTGITMIAFMGFFKMLINSLQAYAVAFVVRSILMGIGPIFIIFLLFEKTKSLFFQWLNVIISTSLQPILLFTFLSFMLVMIESAMKNMLNVELCWMTTDTGGQGVDAKKMRWVFVDPNTGTPLVLDWSWTGNLACENPSGGAASQQNPCGEFPIKIIDVLTFLILVWITQRFASVIDTISQELAGTFIGLDPASRLDSFLKAQTQGSNIFSGANPVNPPTAPRNPPQ